MMSSKHETGAAKRRVAFYGGSFDPPHRAHLAVARAALQALELDSVLFAPVGTQPLKPWGGTASFADRVAMTRLAIDGEAGFDVSLADAPRPPARPNYSIDTLTALKQELGTESALYCLMGADSLASLRFWFRAAELPFVATLVVAGRPGIEISDMAALMPAGICISHEPVFGGLRHGVELAGYELNNPQGELARLILLPGLEDEANATTLRQQLHEDSAEAAAWLPASVLDYILVHQLYK
jgi:nicotinate-nucleotide adenylyltransferase